MSVADKGKGPDSSLPAEKNKRRFLSPEKKYQIFLEAQRGEAPIGELLRREGLYSTDLARIQRKVKEGALEHLAQRPGRSKKTVSEEEYQALKQELQEKERVMAEMAVELAVLRKKTNGGSWER
jgi:transposase-like protein